LYIATRDVFGADSRRPGNPGRCRGQGPVDERDRGRAVLVALLLTKKFSMLAVRSGRRLGRVSP